MLLSFKIIIIILSIIGKMKAEAICDQRNITIHLEKPILADPQANDYLT